MGLVGRRPPPGGVGGLHRRGDRGGTVLHEHMIDQLYVLPSRTGQGIGAALVAHAKRLRPDRLELWTFQSNLGARRFYARHGFTEVELTDGSGNEERAPDVRLRWRAGLLTPRECRDDLSGCVA